MEDTVEARWSALTDQSQISTAGGNNRENKRVNSFMVIKVLDLKRNQICFHCADAGEYTSKHTQTHSGRLSAAGQSRWGGGLIWSCFFPAGTFDQSLEGTEVGGKRC